MNNKEKQSIIDEITSEIMKHSSIAAVWQKLERVHKQQLHILENQRKIAAQINLDL